MKTATVDQNAQTVTIDGKTYRIGDELPPAKPQPAGAMTEAPKIGDTYWVLDGVDICSMVWDGGYDYDCSQLSIGNVYATEEAAALALDRLRAVQVYRAMCVATHPPGGIDWDDDAIKYLIMKNESGFWMALRSKYRNHPDDWHVIGSQNADDILAALTEEQKWLIVTGTRGPIKLRVDS